MLKRFALALIAVVAIAGTVFAQAPWFDHCKTCLKSTVPFSSATSATTRLVAPVSGANIYVCAYDINQVGGTASTILFEYGTSTACTGTTTLIGPFTGNTNAGTVMNIKADDTGYTQFSTSLGGTLVPSQGLCIVTTGTPVQSGYVTYCQE